jgi:prepilin-type N-terminal cleavage/methylation domain-containing protein
MRWNPARLHGFTLIELLVTIAVAAILLMMAVPSFSDFRARSAVRGSVEQLVSAMNMARFEAVKRDRLVKVVFVRDGDRMCVGTALATGTDDDTSCDCFTANACDIARFPANQTEWRRTTWVGDPTMGNNGTAGAGVVVIDPKLGLITETDDAGAVVVNANNGNTNYRLSFDISELGRASVCVPSGSPAIPDYRSC